MLVNNLAKKLIENGILTGEETEDAIIELIPEPKDLKDPPGLYLDAIKDDLIL